MVRILHHTFLVPLLIGLLGVASGVAQVRSFGAGRSAEEPFFVLVSEAKTDTIDRWIITHVKSVRRGIEWTFSNDEAELQRLEAKVDDAITFSAIPLKKVFLIDLTHKARASLHLLEKGSMPGYKTIILSAFNPILYNKRLGLVKFYPKASIHSKAEALTTLDYFRQHRKWDIEGIGKVDNRIKAQDSLISNAQKGLISFEFQTGMWFLLAPQKKDESEFNIADNSWHYHFNLGYGLTNRLVLKLGAGISQKLPDKDDQIAKREALKPRIRITDETQSQNLFMPNIGLKYYLKVGKFKYYGLIGYQRTIMRLTNLETLMDTKGVKHNQTSIMDMNFNSLRYGLGLEATILPRLYFNFQFEGLKSQAFKQPVSGVSSFNYLSFSFGLGIKLGQPK